MYGHERSLVEKMQGRPFVLLGVNSDKEKSRARKAVKENNLNWRSWQNKGKNGEKISSGFKIRGWPTIFLVDHNGVIQAKNLRGSRLDKALELMVLRAEEEGAEGGPFTSPWRTYADASGKFKVEAQFLSMEDKKVTLLLKKGKEKTLPYDKLSKKDRSFINREAKRLRAMNRLQP